MTYFQKSSYLYFLRISIIITAFFCCFIIPNDTYSQQGGILINQWCGINDSESSAVIATCEAQDALNVESSLLGNSLKKRDGFTRDASLSVATSPVNGSFYFTIDNGDNLTVVCHNRQCAKSTNGAAFSVFLTTAGSQTNLPTRWSFVTIDGDLFGANEKRDAVFKYDGTTFVSPGEIPAGSILELTEDRLVVADTSANP